MRDATGQVRLLDFEVFAFGHREWDLAVTGTRRKSFEWITEGEYRQFSDAYGYDILKWDGFDTLRSIRELTMTTWLMQLVSPDMNPFTSCKLRSWLSLGTMSLKLQSYFYLATLVTDGPAGEEFGRRMADLRSQTLPRRWLPV